MIAIVIDQLIDSFSSLGFVSFSIVEIARNTPLCHLALRWLGFYCEKAAEDGRFDSMAGVLKRKAGR